MEKKYLAQLFSLGLVSATVATQTLPAQALDIQFTYAPGVNWYYKAAAETAALYWEDHLSDSATINIQLDVPSADKLPAKVLGGTVPAFVNNVSYGNFRNALSNDRISSNDYTAVANLPDKNYDNSRWCLLSETSGTYCNSTINLTRANAKALGLIDRYSTELDGAIILSDLSNTGYWWETNRANSVDWWEFDFTSVLIHEIGHVLGFVTGLDAVNYYNMYNYTDRQKYVTAFDLFRYFTNTSNFSQQRVELSYGEILYFSINGGQTNLSYFSEGTDTSLGYYSKGDGWQASHWKSNVNAMMNPALSLGTRRNLTTLDLTAFDVIGWNLDARNYDDYTLASWGQWNANSAWNWYNYWGINNMFNQYRWGGKSSSSTFGQGMDLSQFMAQEGLFQTGTFWSYLDEVEANADTAVPEPNSALGLLGLGLLGLANQKKNK